MPGDGNKKEFVYEPLPDNHDYPVVTSMAEARRPTPAYLKMSVDAILEKINSRTEPPMEVTGNWAKVKQAGAAVLWAATKDGSNVTLRAIIPGLKDFLTGLYDQKSLDESDVMDCNGVFVYFHWRSLDQESMATRTPPSMGT